MRCWSERRRDPVLPQCYPYQRRLDEHGDVAVLQSLGGVADVNAHPITIEFHDAGNGRRCASATSSDLATTEASYEWPNLAGGEEQFGNGYFIVAD